MGLLDKFKKTKKNKPTTKTSPKTLTDVIITETEKRKSMSPEELAEYRKQRDIKNKKFEEKRKLDHQIYENHVKGERLEDEGQIDEAIECYKENVSFNSKAPLTYDRLAALYHYKKEFEKERDTLQVYLDMETDGVKSDRAKLDFTERLENVEQFLNTGKWKYDCLPTDPKILSYRVKEAKTLIKSEDKEKGIVMLEDLIENGTYNNTVYNTLYQSYKKEHKFDDCIRICEKAIEVLGFFSNDRKERWNINLEKSLKSKEKSKK